VTGGAGTGTHAGVIKGGGTGEAGVTDMAGVAGSRGGGVAGVFTHCVPGGVGAVVAGGALTGDDALCGGVGKSRCAERTARCVTGIAGKVGRNMVRRFGQARSTKFMTGSAGAWCDAEVIIAGAHPGAGAMTGIARRGGRGVIRRFAHGGLAVVTLAALMRGDANVTESGDTP